MSERKDHTSVKSEVTRLVRGNGGKFRCQKIFFGYAVPFVEQFENGRFDPVGILSRVGTRARNYIQVFSRERFRKFLSRLILSEVREKIGNAEYGVFFVLSDIDVNDRAVFLSTAFLFYHISLRLSRAF